MTMPSHTTRLSARTAANFDFSASEGSLAQRQAKNTTAATSPSATTLRNQNGPAEIAFISLPILSLIKTLSLLLLVTERFPDADP